MKIEYMKEFLLLNKNQNFSKTAKELFIAQSVLSRHISAIEEELGLVLINRDSKTFMLTTAGKIVKEEFLKIVNEYSKMERHLDGLANKMEGELHVGALYHDLELYVYKIIRQFQQQYPKMNVKLHTFQPAELMEALANGKVDAAIHYTLSCISEKSDKIFRRHFIGTSPIQVVFNKGHKFSDKNSLVIEDLKDETLIVFCDTDFEKYTEPLLQFLKSYDVAPGNVIYLQNFDELPFFINESNGICLLPEISYGFHSFLRSLQLKDPRLYFRLTVSSKQDDQNQMIQLFENAAHFETKG